VVTVGVAAETRIALHCTVVLSSLEGLR